MEPSNAITIMPGPYRIRNYRTEGWAVATNKCPGGPYRGVARVPAVFTMERAIDLVARECGLDPIEVRRRNMVQPDEFPYTSVTGKRYDSGSYLESLERLEEVADLDGLRRWQADERKRGRSIGIGVACSSKGLPYYTQVFGYYPAR